MRGEGVCLQRRGKENSRDRGRICPGLRRAPRGDFLGNGSLCRPAEEAPGDKPQKEGGKGFSPSVGWPRCEFRNLLLQLFTFFFSTKEFPRVLINASRQTQTSKFWKVFYTRLNSSTSHHSSEEALRSIPRPEDPPLPDFSSLH